VAAFSGQFDHSIDEKGRVSIPARFREVLDSDGDENLFVTKSNFDGGRCLELYLPKEWERLVGKIRQKSSFNREVRLFQAFYIGGAHEVPVDKQGRILIPPKLREYAGLDRDVTFAALIDRFQLWDRRAHEKLSKTAEEIISNPKFLEKLNL